jgi:hypothetical protein
MSLRDDYGRSMTLTAPPLFSVSSVYVTANWRLLGQKKLPPSFKKPLPDWVFVTLTSSPPVATR